jgi:hypothetical protein
MIVDKYFIVCIFWFIIRQFGFIILFIRTAWFIIRLDFIGPGWCILLLEFIGPGWCILRLNFI